MTHYKYFYSSLNNLSDAFWGNITTTTLDPNEREAERFGDLLDKIMITVENSLFATFHIDSIADTSNLDDPDAFELDVWHANLLSLDLVVSFPNQPPITLPPARRTDSTSHASLRLHLCRHDSDLDERPIHHRPHQALATRQLHPRVNHHAH